MRWCIPVTNTHRVEWQEDQGQLRLHDNLYLNIYTGQERQTAQLVKVLALKLDDLSSILRLHVLLPQAVL